MTVATEHTGYLSTINRIKTLLFAILCACAGHGLLSYLVPISLNDNGINQTLIGLTLSAYSVGFFLGCFFSNRVISDVGHIRTYSAVASIIAISALLHSFFGNFIVTALLRFVVGIAMASVYITLESWLNGASSSKSRGTVLGVYQTAVGVGFAASPWLLNSFDKGDPRLYSIVAVLLALSLVPLSISRRPAPQIPDSSAVYSFTRLFLDSPSAVVGTIGAGLIALPLNQLMVVFLVDEGYSGFILSLILSGAFVGVFLFQMPIGKLADRFDKRKIYLSLLVLLILVCLLILYNNAASKNIWILAAGYLVAVGCANCLHPLSITLLFEQIDTENAVSATSSMTVMHSFGLIAGPIIAGVVMDVYGSKVLLSYSIVVAQALVLFLIVRIYMLKITISEENLPYFMTMQNLRPSNINLNPTMNYAITQINDSAFTNLVNALSRSEDNSQRKKVLADSLYQSGMTPEKIVLNLVLSLPRMSDKILKSMLALHPELRQTLAEELHDLIGLNKKRINAILLKGLSSKASRQEKSTLKKYFERSIREEKERLLSLEVNAAQ